MTPTFSLVINHTPWVPERQHALRDMYPVLNGPGHEAEKAFLLNKMSWRGVPWQGGAKLAWQLTQWLWAANVDTTHHVFMTDDLHLMPVFWSALSAMVTARSECPIGLLSNHPRGPDLYDAGYHGYTTRAWLVGPAYVIPHALLLPFLQWFVQEPGDRLRGPTSWNDDNVWNEWIAKEWRGHAWHPLPTIIEHRGDLSSTVGHGDKHSRERISWRERRTVKDDGERWAWVSEPWKGPTSEEMSDPKFWADDAPLLAVGG
jgi:hypothetical protein